MNATCTNTNLWNKLFFSIFALPLGLIVLLLASIGILASFILIITPIGMMLAPTWSVQLFCWEFESALDAWYLSILGILLAIGMVYMLTKTAQFSIFMARLWTCNQLIRHTKLEDIQ